MQASSVITAEASFLEFDTQAAFSPRGRGHFVASLREADFPPRRRTALRLAAWANASGEGPVEEDEMEWLETLSKYVGWLAGIATGLATIAGVGLKLWQFWFPAPAEPKPMQAILVDGRVEATKPAWPAWAWVLGFVLPLWVAFGARMAASVAVTGQPPTPPPPPPDYTLVGRWSTTDRGPYGEPVQVTFRADGVMEMNGQVKGTYAYRGDSLQF